MAPESISSSPDDFVHAMLVTCPTDVTVPGSLTALFRWAAEHGAWWRAEKGVRGVLVPEGAVDGPMLVLDSSAQSSVAAAYMPERPDDWGDLWFFAKVSPDGSMAALWTSEGSHHVVLLGSGSGSTMATTVGTADDFLRLIAVGYEDLGDLDDDYDVQPPPVPGFDPIRRWVADIVSTPVPATAEEILGRPARLGDPDSDDPFWRWLRKADHEADGGAGSFVSDDGKLG